MAIEHLRMSAYLSRVSVCALVAAAAALPSGMSAAQESADAVAAEDLTLETIDITAARAGATEGTGSYAAEGVTPSATGLPLTQRELPQSVSIITNQEITDQNFQTLNEVVDYTPGLFAAQGNGEFRWSYYARGSEITNLQVDGVPGYVHFYARDILPQDDMAIYDRVEVVRGATGLLEGTGNPSASVNLVRKRAFDTREISAETAATTYGSAQVIFDASTPLNEAGTIRGRMVAKGVGGDGPRDNLTGDRGLIYGTLDFDIGDRTTASLGAMYAKEDIDGYSWGGLWSQVDGEFYDFDGDTSPSLWWEFSDREAYTGFLDMEHALENGWTLKLAGRAVDGDSDMFSSYMRWQPTEAGEPELQRAGSRIEYTLENYALDAQASGPFTLFGREHEAVIGMNGNHDNTRYDGGSDYVFVIDNPAVADPNAEPKPPFSASTYSWDMTTEQYGAYAATRLSLTDNFKAIAGGRFTWYDYEDDSGGGSTSSYSVDGEFVPYLGVVYDINADWSVYASFTEIFQPQQVYGVNGLLDPIRGRNYEAGVKAEFFGDRIIAAAAIFQTDRDGLPEVDPNNLGCGPTADPTCYRAAENVRTQGAEIEVSGAITDRWNLMASYTYANVEYEAGPFAGERYQPNVNPRSLAKLATTYQIGGALEGLTVGGALRYQSAIYAEGTDWASADLPFKMEQGGYAVVDLMARYDFSEATSLQVNVDNLFNKTYYSSFWNPGYGNFIGPERSATITLSQTF